MAYPEGICYFQQGNLLESLFMAELDGWLIEYRLTYRHVRFIGKGECVYIAGIGKVQTKESLCALLYTLFI